MRARCLVFQDGRAVFATPAASCPAGLEDPRNALCTSRECPFKGQPHLARLTDDGLTIGELFWCTGGRQIDRRALSEGLAQLVITALRGGAAQVAVSTGAGAGRLVEVDQLRN